jgi:hypothetical protein
MTQAEKKIRLIPLSKLRRKEKAKIAILNVRLERELYEEFKDFVENTVETTLSDFIRTLAIQYLAEYSGNPKYFGTTGTVTRGKKRR